MTPTWQVALCSPPYRVFSYRTPDYLPDGAWAAGQRVIVPVGSMYRLGVIVSQAVLDPDQGGDRVLKPLAWPVDRELLLTDQLLDLVRHLALRQMQHEGRVLSVILPKALRSANPVFSLSDSGVRRRVTLSSILKSPTDALASFGRAWMDGRLTPVKLDRGACAGMDYHLLRDPPWGIRPGAKRQLAVLEHLFTHGRASRPSLQRAVAADVGNILKELERKGLVQAVPAAGALPRECLGAMDGESLPDGDHPSLSATVMTPEQTAALADLEAGLAQSHAQGRALVRLVHGATGSGKTLLYLLLARSCLEAGRSVLLLAPEVALSAQLWAAVSRQLHEYSRHWYHGYLSPSAKLAIFRSVHRGGPCIVVGTRSALFLPFSSLGLVILDEEHDASYKQDEGLAYQAKEVAYFRIKDGGLLVLGSATPDIKTHYATIQGEIARVALVHRISKTPTPEIRLVDMRQVPRSETLSQVCRDALLAVLEQGEQAMFLLNRRGFAPLVSCLDCGRSPQCPRCEVGLTYHKGWERLLCHYCGFTLPFPCVCSHCGGSRFLPLGEGTERLEEYLAGLIPPELSIVRLDRDSTRRKGRLEDVLTSFGQGRAQVMVGTQMLSKGHHFPNVTLVTAVDGDVGLNLPDYRAAEKTFQLLVQLSGRAGRGERPGRVLIQTRNPDHPCWTHIRNGDYHGFFTQELERRRKFGYPPFVKLGMVRFNYPREWKRGEGLLAQAGDHLQREGARIGLRVLGPAPAPLGLLNGRKRFHCLLKASQWQNVRDVYSSLLRIMPGSSPLRTALDLDPLNML